MSKNIINTNIRFNLDNADDRKAYEYLQGMDRKKYKSYTKAVVIALIEISLTEDAFKSLYTSMYQLNAASSSI